MDQRTGQTDKTQTETQSLSEQISAPQWQAVFDALPDGVCLLDPGGKIVLCNAALAVLLGQPRDEILGRPCWEAVFGATGPLPADPVEEARCTGQRSAIQLPLGDRWFNVTADPILDETGDAVGFVYMLVDITRQVRAEAALRADEERFRSLYQEAPLGYQSLDRDGRFIDANQAWLDTFGYSRDEVIGRWFGDFLAPQQMALFRERFSHFKATGEAHGVEFEMVCRDGSHRIVSFDGRCAYDEWGNLEQTHCILHDVTERTRAEATLRESEARFSTVFRASPLSIAITRLEDNQFIDVNEAWQRTTGFTREEVIGRTPVELNTWVNPGERERLIRVLHEQGAVQEFEFQMRQKSGNICDLLLSAERIEVVGEHCMLSMALDITERKRAEEALRKSLEETAHNQRLLLALSQAAQAVQRAHTPDEVCRTILESDGCAWAIRRRSLNRAPIKRT